VIGGGVVGVATAYWLARFGAAPLLLEAREPACGASGRNAGFVLAGRSRLEDPQAFRDVLRIERIDADYNEQGHLALASSAEVMHAFRTEVASRPGDAAPLHALDRSECEHLLALRLGPQFHGGRWLPGAATIDPLRLVGGLAAATETRGGTIATRTPVHSLRPSGDTVVVETQRGRVEAAQVIVACNIGTRHLLSTGAALTPSRGQMLATIPTKRVFRIGLAVDWGSVYWRQTADGTILLGGCRGADPQAESTARAAVNPRIQAALIDFLPRSFPDLPRPAVARSWAGIMDETPDGAPIVGRWPRASNCWIAAGFGGHGIPPAIGVGRALAESVLTGTSAAELHRFRPERMPDLVGPDRATRKRRQEEAVR
jgi:glycine/D-amino acid oxidase-like deaminating enzyme